MNFTELIGSQIVLLVPRLNEKALHDARLVGVEANGIWIEHITFVSAVYRSVTGKNHIPDGRMASAKVFVPFHEIAVVMAAVPVANPALEGQAGA